MVVNTGDSFTGRQVLISRIFLRQVDHGGQQLHIALTKQQIDESPEIDTHKPITRQHETA